jgi:hypothetical protein
VADKEEKPIRVVDRRMFTADGELRPDFEPEEASAPPPPAPARQAPPPRPAPTARPAAPAPAAAASAPAAATATATETVHEDADEPGGAGGEEAPGEPAGEFSAIVRSLATTAYSALGLLPDPSGTRHRDPAIARQMIDWLGVIESKTRNNLSFEESDFLARVLYELRLAFVEVTRPARR